MIRLVLACLFAAAPLVAAAQPTTLHLALREDPDLLDPALGRTFVGRIVFAGLCDKLFDIDQKLNIVPQLATGFEWTDPKTLVIHLRPGVKFQDGTTMDAVAVKYSLERSLTMPGSARVSEINAMDHVDVVDPATVRVVLKAPSAPFLAQLTDRAGMIISPTAAEKAGKNFSQHPVCAGPMKFVERVAQDHITLERFADYWNKDAIHFDRVIYQPVPDSSVRLADLQAGSVDFVEYITPTDIPTVQADHRLKLVTYNGLGYEGITYNLGNGSRADTPMGRSALVRQAFDLSIDRDELLKVVYNGMLPATAQPVPPESPFFDPALQPPKRDLAKAKALLQQAGVKARVPVSLLAANEPDLQQMAEVIQSMASDAGFDVKITAMEFASSLAQARDGGFEAYIVGWSGRVDPDGDTYAFLHTGGSENYGHYSSQRADMLLQQGRTEQDMAKRRDTYGELFKLDQTDLPISYLYTQRYFTGMTTKVSGFTPVADGIIRLQGMSLAP